MTCLGREEPRNICELLLPARVASEGPPPPPTSSSSLSLAFRASTSLSNRLSLNKLANPRASLSRNARRPPIAADADTQLYALLSGLLAPAPSSAATGPTASGTASMNGLAKPGLKHLPPYWHVYATRAKQRWLGRPLVEVLAEEYRDRCEEYYVRKSTAFI